MLNWNQARWQFRHFWSFLRHAYRRGWSFYEDITDTWLHRRRAMAYAVVQVAPRTYIAPRRY